MSAPRIAVAGASGTIGKAITQALLDRGYSVCALLRAGATWTSAERVEIKTVNYEQPETLREALAGCDAVISCLASRSGAPKDAWRVDKDANSTLLAAALETHTSRFILLSAICVQKPKLAFQLAKRAFEAELKSSPLDWTIIHPTAFFKSLSGQVARVQGGKPFLVFGDGTLTACKPISDRDLAQFIVETFADPSTIGATRPVGGPGPAISPKRQAEILARLLDRDVPIKQVPVAMMKIIIGLLSLLGMVIPSFRDRAEFARIGLYYGTESMLVWDDRIEKYDADATPEFGKDRLEDHYQDLLSGKKAATLGQHTAFG